jgi:hypothetical protein
MNDDVKQTVSGESTQDTGLPQPQFSDQPPASPTSTLAPEQILESLKPLIKAEAERAAQSVKDKRFSELDGMKEILARIKEGGGTIPPAMESQLQMQEAIDRALTERGVAPVSGKSMTGAGANPAGTFDVLGTLNQLGLNTSDPAVEQMVKGLGTGKYRNPDHFIAEAAKLALEKSKQPAAPSDTGTPPPTGGAPQTPPTEAEKEEMYAKLNKLYKTPSQNAAEIKKLEKDLGI